MNTALLIDLLLGLLLHNYAAIALQRIIAPHAAWARVLACCHWNFGWCSAPNHMEILSGTDQFPVICSCSLPLPFMSPGPY
jgi:hypothetical protein